MSPIRVAIVDDHPLFRAGVSKSLAELGHFEVVAEGSSSIDAINIAQEQRPDVLLLDISMPGGGQSALEAILAQHPDQKIVILTVSETADDVTQALNNGAKGYLLKGVGSKSLSEILRYVASGETYVSPTLSARLLAALASGSSSQSPTRAVDSLTEREKEVLGLVAAGLSNKEIAIKLDLYEKTIKHHLTRIFGKLNVKNRTEAAMVYRDARDRSPARLSSG